MLTDDGLGRSAHLVVGRVRQNPVAPPAHGTARSRSSTGYLPFPGIAPSSQGTPEPPRNSEDVCGEWVGDV